MSKKNSLVAIIVFVLVVSFVLVSGFISNEVNNSDNALKGSSAPCNVYSLSVPNQLNFAGEVVPLEDPDINMRLDREFLVNTYWQSNAILLIKRAQKYFPIIEPILEEHGVPDDFKYLSLAESGFTQVVSPAGATGFWQLMKPTAQEYGLEVNKNVDERYHLEKSTHVACKYLLNAKEKFGSWTLAAAAYNAGNTGISRQLERQKASNYYDLLLVEETSRYVFRILAMKSVIGNYEDYGFQIDKNHFYPEISVRKVQVDTSVSDLADFAKKMNISYKTLKLHNPWLREVNLVNNSKKTYEIEIPEEGQYQIFSNL